MSTKNRAVFKKLTVTTPCVPYRPPKKKYRKPWSPATYRTEVEGPLEESWADGFGGMTIKTRKRPIMQNSSGHPETLNLWMGTG